MRYWVTQVARGFSRLANAVIGGEGDVTFSAGSHDRAAKGRAGWAFVERLIDAVAGKAHCRLAWEWHRERDLLRKD